MRKFLIGMVLGCVLTLTGGSKATAQVSWIYWQNMPSVGSTQTDFLNWLNYERSIRGLASVGYDTSLEYDCHQNNLYQAAQGLGHFYMGRARRQNASAVPDFGRVGPCWVTSPGHYAALFDPTIQWIAITYYAGYTTFSAY